MRDILFRGKRLNNGEWKFGSYVYQYGCHEILLESCESEYGADHYGVDPATVGEFTGLTDKNGTKIFEGDVVRYTERKFNGSDVQCIKHVEFAEGGWCVDCWFLNNWLFDGANGNIQLEEIEIIGNIHDNPELLEG